MEEVLQELKGSIERYRGKRYHIIGIGRSGVSIANLLNELDADVSISDLSSRDSLATFVNDIPAATEILTGRQDEGLLDDIDYLVLSPGVPHDSDIVTEATRRFIDVVGEVELSYRIMKAYSRELGVKTRWFGITGTNGKSTTTTLLHEMLSRGGRNSVLAGNIGYPVSAAVGDVLRSQRLGKACTEYDFVLELSSFQLETIKEFRLDFSALLNITEDHLDRYEDFKHYAWAKAGVFNNQDITNCAIINHDDPQVASLLDACSASRFFVSSREEVCGSYLKDGKVFLRTNGDVEFLIHASEIRIVGIHNLYNALSASLMAFLGGVGTEAIASTLRTFRGLEHRLEFAAEIKGVRFYNDSKGTNVGAVMKSLESFAEGVVLIAGGRDKGGDFSSLIPYVRDRVKKIIVIGEAAEKIRTALGSVVDTERALSLRDAVTMAYHAASAGDTVLFSPACASFDMFRNFEERGRQFKDIIEELKEWS